MGGRADDAVGGTVPGGDAVGIAALVGFAVRWPIAMPYALVQVFMPATPFAALCLAATPWTAAPADVFLATATLLVCMSQQFHAWAHMKKSQLPAAVNALQVCAYPLIQSVSRMWLHYLGRLAFAGLPLLVSRPTGSCSALCVCQGVSRAHCAEGAARAHRMRACWCRGACTARTTARHSRATTASSAACGTARWTRAAPTAASFAVRSAWWPR